MSAFIPNSILLAPHAMSDPIACCRDMPMRATTVRFDESLWNMLEGEARTQGVSAAQFVRDATILRVAALAAQRGDEDTKLTVEAVAQGALRARGRATAGDAIDGLPMPPEVHDAARLRALNASGLLDLHADPEFDRLARLSARVLETPVALVTLVDRDRQILLGCVGVPEPWVTTRETALEHSVCPFALAADEPLIVPDIRDHPILRQDPKLEEFGVRAYAGARLCDDDGHAIGTLCVVDAEPRQWSDEMRATLVDLATSVMTEMRLRRR